MGELHRKRIKDRHRKYYKWRYVLLMQGLETTLSRWVLYFVIFRLLGR